MSGAFVARLQRGPMDGAELSIAEVEPVLNCAFALVHDDSQLQGATGEIPVDRMFRVFAIYVLTWQLGRTLNYQYLHSKSTAGLNIKSVTVMP